MSEMRVSIDRRTAYIHTDTPLVEGLEGLLGAAQCVIYVKQNNLELGIMNLESVVAESSLS